MAERREDEGAPTVELLSTVLETRSAAPQRVCPQCQQRYAGTGEYCPRDGARLQLAPPEDPFIGQTIGRRFTLVRRIGRGGMGVVYLATHVYLNRPCAVKLLHRRYINNERVLSRFMREARVASCVDHEHIVTIYDYGQTEQGEPYLVMEYVEGITLHRELSTSGPGTLALPRVLDIALQAARALAHAHERGVVHRDIKPENILLTHRDGMPDFVKLLDFGLAKIVTQPSLTLAGQEVMGTPEFMAPEMVRNPERAAAPVDLYAMGVLLFELLSGGPPFSGTLDEVLIGHLTKPPPDLALRPELGLPRELSLLIARLLSKEAAERPSAADLVQQLEAIQKGLPQRSLRSILLAQTLLGSDAAQLSSSQTLILPPRTASGPEGPKVVPAELLHPTLGDLSRLQTLVYTPPPSATAPPGATLITGGGDRPTLIMPAMLRDVDSMEARLSHLRAELLLELSRFTQRLGARAQQGALGEELAQVEALQQRRLQLEQEAEQLEQQVQAEHARVQRQAEVLRQKLRDEGDQLKGEDARPGAEEPPPRLLELERAYFGLEEDQGPKTRLQELRWRLHQCYEDLHRALVQASRRVLDATWPGGLREDHRRFAEVVAQFDNGVRVLEEVLPASAETKPPSN